MGQAIGQVVPFAVGVGLSPIPIIAVPEMPAWMQTVDRFTTGRSIAIGVALSAINPKNLILTIGAASAIASTGVSAAS